MPENKRQSQTNVVYYIYVHKVDAQGINIQWRAWLYRPGLAWPGPEPSAKREIQRASINDKQGRITGLRVQPPSRNVEKKNFWQCKKSTPSEMRALTHSMFALS